MPKSGTNGTVVVQVRRTNRNDDYTIMPNDLIRGSGVYAGLCPEERIVLMGGLSCRDEYETTLARVEGWLAAGSGKLPGRNRQEAFRRTLRERGFLTTERGNIPAGRSDGGQIMWTYTFHMDPLPIDARDVLPAKKDRFLTVPAAAEGDRDVKEETAGQTMPPNSGHGNDTQTDSGKTAGQTMPPLSGHGGPGHGQPGPGEDHVYKEEKNQGSEELKTSSSLSSEDAAGPSVAAREEEEPSIDEEHRTLAASLLAKLFGRQHVSESRRPTGTKHTQIVRLLADRLGGGWGPDPLFRALDEPLVGVDSIFAVMRHRLLELPDEPPVAAAPKPRAPRCDKGSAHASYPAGDCVICQDAEQDAKVRAAIETADAATDKDRPAAATTQLSGIEAARAIAARAGTGRKVELSRWPDRTATGVAS